MPVQMERVIYQKRLLLCITNLSCCRRGKSISSGVSKENEGKIKKKDVSQETMASSHSPKSTESQWYDWWDSKGYFKPKNNKKVFTLLLPPPNITGTLHLGHALTITVQDVYIRWMRMKGENVLWIPGFDHAGIATQAVVEKYIKNVLNVTKNDLGKKNFLNEVLNWKTDKENTIINQMKQLGASVDWSRQYFTLDETSSEAVAKAFIHLYNRGLIHRHNGLINWSCYLKSALSDIEVEKREIDEPCNINVPGYKNPIKFGYMYKFAYKILDNGKEGNELVISTTRPETILGDTAVAVHPDDTRYSHLKDKFVWHPFRMCKIPIIFDKDVNPELGTGVLKITPAHSVEDLEIAKRHDLKILDVIDENGCVKEEDYYGQFQGMKRFDARNKMLNELQNLGVYKGKDKHSMVVPLCSRSGDVVEYLIKPQWVLKCNNMYEKVQKVISDGTVRIEPDYYKAVLDNWFSKGKDWNLSRQIWVGHQIPIYDCKVGSESIWIPATSSDEARLAASKKLKSDPAEIDVTQDPDVLDTWFSSALLPLTVCGWPHRLDQCYPIGLMETGRDILFFWVARMIMLSLEIAGKVPFNHVVLHGLVCDAYGRKMSKSLGNVVLPEDVIKGISLSAMNANSERNCQLGLLSPQELKLNIEGQKKMFPSGIPECGADALRLTLCNDIILGDQLNFSIHVCQANRFFCNKMWQALIYFLKNVGNLSDFSAEIVDNNFSMFDSWILSRLAETVKLVNEGIGNFQYHLAVQAIRNFVVKQFCDIYLESSKPIFQKNSMEESRRVASVMFNCWETLLLLSSPFMPFITEELYHRLPKARGFVPSESIMEAKFPNPDVWSRYKNPKIDELMSRFIKILSDVRSARSIYKLSKQKLKVILSCSADSGNLFSDEIKTFLKRHASVHEFIQSEGDVPERNVIKLINEDFTAYLYHEHSKDVLQDMFGSALSKEGELEEHLQNLKSMMSQPNYDNETEKMKRKNLMTLTHLAAELKKIKEVKEVIEKAE